jgi:hypothetical protein
MKSRIWIYLCLLALAPGLACSQQNNLENQPPNISRAPGEGQDIDIDQGEAVPEAVPVSEDKIPAGFEELTWQKLADVEYEARWFEEINDSLLYPHFGAQVKAAENNKVYVSGYVIPVSYERYVLSANPFSSCFFCGNAGPETVMELALNQYEDQMFFTDEFRTFTGTFRLNNEDTEKLNYILEGAEAL